MSYPNWMSNDSLRISVSSPSLSTVITSACSQHPRLVIIFSWMDAPVQLVFSKYAIKFRQMYPATKIAVVLSRTGFMWCPEKRRRDNLQPLAEYVLKTVYTQSANPLQGVLVHVLSNGGALNLLVFSEVLHDLFHFATCEKRESQIRASIVLDSAPGDGEWMSAYTTFLAGFGINTPGKSIAKGALAAATSFVWVGYTLKNKVEGLEGLFTRLNKFLLSENILPCASDPQPRLYDYSTMDGMVPYSAVEQHLTQFLRIRSLTYEERGRRVWVRKLDRARHLGGESALRSGNGAHDLSYWELIDTVWANSAPLDTRAKL